MDAIRRLILRILWWLNDRPHRREPVANDMKRYIYASLLAAILSTAYIAWIAYAVQSTVY